MAASSEAGLRQPRNQPRRQNQKVILEVSLAIAQTKKEEAEEEGGSLTPRMEPVGAKNPAAVQRGCLTNTHFKNMF
jgi:hypothetical protein